LRYAGAEFAKAGLILTVEPLNSIDTPGFLLDTSGKAMAVLSQVALDNVRLQYDLYHMHIMGDDLAAVMKRLLPAIGHIQFADAPGRHEPGTGEINLAAMFAHIDAIGYVGWVSAEYRPSGNTEDSLGWFKAAKI
jgi:hydroxypyruvate isomerase